MSGEETVLKINVTGGGGSGKTRLIITAGTIAQDKNIRVDNLTPWSEELVSTVGGQFFNFGPFKGKELKKSYQFAVWDLGGQIRYSDVRKIYLEGTDAILAVVDASRKYSLKILKSAMLRTEVKEVCNDTVPILICGHKTDLRDLVLEHIDQISEMVYNHLQGIIEKNMTEYEVVIKIGPEKGLKTFQAQIKLLNDQPALKAADFEASMYKLFSEWITNADLSESFTEMNLKLLARELWFILTDALFKDLRGDSIPYSLLERASLGSPLFREYTKDPDILIPIDWSKERLKSLIESVVIKTEELNAFAEELKSEGFQITGVTETSVLKNQKTAWSAFSHLFAQTIASKTKMIAPDVATEFTLADFEDF
ncbi:MAG: ADP-ribosylation factor-like protein [Promethearchaeota archaeon]